jgi:hypothetical protein
MSKAKLDANLDQLYILFRRVINGYPKHPSIDDLMEIEEALAEYKQNLHKLTHSYMKKYLGTRGTF